MKLARIEYRGTVYTATVTCSGYALEDGTVLDPQQVRLLPPVMPGKILGVGWNFPAHVEEMVDRTEAGQKITEPPKEEVPPPLLFFKPSSSLIGHEADIIYPSDATRVEFEGELAVVISKSTRRVTPAEAADCIWGWTCANDITERDMQAGDGQWWRAKGYDTFAVAGPFLETEAPSPEAWIRTTVNGKMRQKGQVRDMFRDPYTVISIISQAMTLQRGDLIMLGTPPGVGELRPGDKIEIEIDGVGYLSNKVVAEK
jgi:2-keto-4-pentenoate hydratase/2-oxohepta-3-ene-1,7-dioic acid hydratase in catechol pathway